MPGSVKEQKSACFNKFKSDDSNDDPLHMDWLFSPMSYGASRQLAPRETDGARREIWDK